MGFRSIKAKKYNGIYEYFKNSDGDKKTTAYYIAYRDIDDKVKKIRCDAKDKDEALKMLNAKKSELTQDRKEIQRDDTKLQQKVLNNSMTLDDVAKIFHSQRTNKDALQERQKFENHIQPFLGKKKISKINTKMLQEFQKYLSSKTVSRYKRIMGDDGKYKTIEEKIKLSPRTIKHILEYLRVIFNWSIEEGHIKTNPMVIKKIVNQVEDSEPGRVLLDKELDALWELDELKMNDRLYLFLKACYFTGARPAGIIDLQVKHINFATKEIKIKAMKKGKSYQAKASEELLGLLKRWIAKYSLTHDNYIFFPIQSYLRAATDEEKQQAKNKSANYSGYRRLLQKIFDPVFNIGIDPYDRMYRVNVYTMRRTSGTKIYKKYGIVHAKKFLNHTDIKTTMHYLNIEDDTEVLVDAL